MAYVGFWLNGSHGKLSGSTLYKSKGGTQIRSINTTPTNPRTDSQMLHRSLFLDAVKFFHDAKQALFQFAFQYKKTEWSEFNAFMNANHNNGVNITKAQFDCTTYPALGNWLMSEGSLSQMNLSYNESDRLWTWGLSEQSENIGSIGQISQALLDDGAEKDDIITAVGIWFQQEYAYGTDLSPLTGTPRLFNIYQFKVNVNDSRSWTDVLGTPFLPSTHKKNGVIFNDSTFDTPVAMCIIHSRVVNGKTYASTQRIIGNKAWNDATTLCSTDDYISNVLAAWKSSGTAILQGGISEDQLSITGFRGARYSLAQCLMVESTGVGEQLASEAPNDALCVVVVEGTGLSKLTKDDFTSSSSHVTVVNFVESNGYYYLRLNVEEGADTFSIRYDGNIMFTAVSAG